MAGHNPKDEKFMVSLWLINKAVILMALVIKWEYQTCYDELNMSALIH